MFGVYHPRKKDSVRMVFDSSAKFNNISLNDVLLKGPDITNNLQDILLRFRREEIAVIGDVEQMFHNLDMPLKEYRMSLHTDSVVALPTLILMLSTLYQTTSMLMIGSSVPP